MSARAAPAAYARRIVPGIHAECGEKLVRGRHPGTWVHEATGSVRCPPAQRVCGVCEREGLVACLDPGCAVMAHPGGCMNQCTCCRRWGCQVHVQLPELLCIACAEHGPIPDHEVIE